MPSRTAPAMSCTRGSSVARPGGSSTARSLCVRMPRKPTPSRPTRRCCSSTTRVLPRAPRETRPRFDVRRVREDFPILRQKIHGKPLIYLDNAASTQKPQVVIDTLHRYYETNNANVHRGVHLLSQRATQEYEDARVKAQRFLNAAESREVIFVRGTTEGINLVAQSYGRKHLRADDEVVITTMEHHSNIVPWQI